MAPAVDDPDGLCETSLNQQERNTGMTRQRYVVLTIGLLLGPVVVASTADAQGRWRRRARCRRSASYSTVVQPTTAVAEMNKNQAILDEVNQADGEHVWFAAKKTAPLWAKELDKPQTIQTLEGPVEGKKGDFLCRGAAGEYWPQGAQRFKSRYEATDEVDEKGFRKYTPTSKVMAALVSHAFQVHSSRGLLKGKAGDFIVKGFNDRDNAYPKDVWIVDAKLFGGTYSKID